MTAPITQQQQPPAPSKDAATARKRRRRAPAGGAADDCFTCSKRGVKCDRRRPYCSQCLEIGNECSGYKTQLTWGVGVASRGKLRGLSLPIAKAPPVAGAQQPKKTTSPRSRASSSAANAHWPDADERARRPARDDGDIASDHTGSTPTTPFSSYDLLALSQPQGTPPLVQESWAAMHSPYSSSLPAPGDGPRYQKLGAHLAPLPIGSDALSRSLDSVSDVDYMSPLSHSFSRDDVAFMHSPTLMYETYSSHGSPIPQSPAAIIMDHHRAPTSCPSLVYAASEQSSSLSSHLDSYELSQRLLQECDTMSPWPSLHEPHRLHVNPDLLAKMPFFLDYYKNIMCPSMVFVDGPHNPYRNHILQLAGGSESLRHAICALSACNLRMKRRLSLGQDARELSEKLFMDKSAAEPRGDGAAGDQSLLEEYQHRNLAINLLNQQLNDPTKSSHDSVLATILLLCHYRMMESGIAKFQTQFAGVRKILSLRRSHRMVPSTDTAWMEATFTYFDAISASINDREAQLTPSFYGVPADTQLLPAGAENLVGCDRELFKTISRLGRLNLLSQQRPVQTVVASPVLRSAPSRSQSPLGSPIGHAYRTSIATPYSPLPSPLGDGYPLPTQRFDGNGFGTTLNDDEVLQSALRASGTYDDHRATFWREWKEVRLALQGWSVDSARLHATLPEAVSASQVRDLGSLSEAFRYAALLYTERLASPRVPSTHAGVQTLVSQVVLYASSLEAGSAAEKFLLWPLFVAGSECVNELQRGIVRSKCRDIMTRSGYMNNVAALDVLERLWAGEGEETPTSPGTRSPFKWARCIGGPGVEVEWIMF